MTNLAVEAKLIGDNTIQIDVDASYVNAKNRKFALVLNGKTIENLKCISKSDSNRKIIYTVHNQTKIIVGYDYQIKDDSNEFYPLDVSYLATKQSFIDKYKTDLELGAIYSKESTTFRVFSPLASDIAVVIETRDGKDSQLHNMTKDFETGLFEITVKGDFDGFRYRYLVKIMGEIHLVVDPYAFSLSTNSRFGYIVDMNKVLAIPNYDDKLPKVDNPLVLICDPMLATGGSASDAISILKKRGYSNIRLLCLVGAPEGVKKIEEEHPDVDIYLCALDEKLNEKGYIIPGLGDAGDRIFGTY